MGIEVNLMQNYPYSQRDISGRLESKTQHDKLIAMEFGQEFFDGSRNHGYGGFSYNSRFWKNVVPDFIQHWQLKNGDSLLDIGCAKGFMLYDLKEYLPNLDVYGVDISEYAINNANGWSYGVSQLLLSDGHIQGHNFISMIELKEKYDKR